MPTRACLIAFALGLGAVSACEPKVDYHTVEFPGFTLSVLTTTTYTPSAHGDYPAGQASASGLIRIVNVSWQVGALSTPAELPALVDVMDSVLPAGSSKQFGTPRQFKVGDHDAIEIVGTVKTEGAKIDMAIVDVACGKRSVTISIVAAQKLEALKQHILDSFVCKPDAAEEAKLGTTAIPFGLDDPALLAGWTRAPAEDSMFLLQKEGSVVVVMQTPRFENDEKEGMKKALPGLMTANGLDWTATSDDTRMSVTGPRTLFRGNLMSDGVPLVAGVAMFACAERNDGVMAIAMAATSAELEESIKLVLGMRCPTSKDAPLVLPPTPAETDETDQP